LRGTAAAPAAASHHQAAAWVEPPAALAGRGRAHARACVGRARAAEDAPARRAWPRVAGTARLATAPPGPRVAGAARLATAPPGAARLAVSREPWRLTPPPLSVLCLKKRIVWREKGNG